MMDPLSINLRFVCSKDSYEESEIVIYGAPLDLTTVFKPGMRFAPTRVREMSYALETYSPVGRRDLSQINFFDVGNNYSPFYPQCNVRNEINKIYRDVKKIVKDEKKLIVLGGEHLITFPIVKALVDHFPDLIVVHFDAHADLRDEYCGEKFSHATVMRRVAEIIGIDNLFQFGIRSGIKEEFDFAKNIYPDIKSTKKILDKLRGRPVYISIDIDVFDPAFAPGTGTPEPCGCTPNEFFEVLYGLAGLNIVGVDVVEISPPYDCNDITSLLGAKIVRECLICLL